MPNSASPTPPPFPSRLVQAIPENCRQLITVFANDLNSTHGHLWLMERSSYSAPWTPTFGPVDVTLGRHGLAWSNEFPPPNPSHSIKREGDQRAPIGVYAVPFAFGSQPTANTAMSYQQMTPDHAGIDDPHSRYYNRIVDVTRVGRKDWNSAENMLPSGGSYELALFVDYNAKQVPHAGSCIFIHVWLRPGEPTSGCTAMDKKSLTKLLNQLRPEAQPHLLQFAPTD